ncbi:hypothetical protein E4U42_007401 [Claviceps africana]|uniref:Uncharacterized protein n=1 Tax=Claviceps africana TaxID=83212 RepID=A0A8K0J1E4_9HYPO|nr:hypothetical protein E4U42_007401 [Claviceps africana]
MRLLPEQSQNRASSIPVEQSTSEGSVTSQAHSDTPYRGSSVCSSASSSLESLTLTTGSSSRCPCPTKNHPCVSHSIHRLDKKEEDQREQLSNSNESNSTSSSLSSSDSSTNEESQTAPQHIDDDINNNHSNSNSNNNNNNNNNKMLSAGSINPSGSSSSIDSFDVPVGDEAPMLPPRSARRVSRLTIPIPPKKTTNDEQPMLPHAAPHQMYLSSEEDASSSADDFSDFEEELELGNEKSEKTTERRISREDTARMVAVIFYGKPSIVTMSSRRSISPSSSSSQQTVPTILRTTTEPVLSRPHSVSPTCSSTTAFHLPPRSSSMLTAGGCDSGVTKKRPGFLQIDPYSKDDDDFPHSARTPKTPTTMLRKTLNLVKKRSKQNLCPSETHVSHMAQVGEVEEENDPRESICMGPQTPSLASYQDIMRSAKRNTLMPPVSRSEVAALKSPRNRFRSGLSLGRQRSVRA